MNLKERAESMAMSHFLCDEGDLDFDGLIEQLRAGVMPTSVNPWEPFENEAPQQLAEEMETYAESMERQLREVVRPLADALHNLGAAIESGDPERIAHVWIYEGEKRLQELGINPQISPEEFNAADANLLQRIQSMGTDAIDQLAVECIKNGYEGEDLAPIAETLSMYYGSDFNGIFHEAGDQSTAKTVLFIEQLADAKLNWKWTGKDSKSAQSQGWDVFEASVDNKMTMLIERCDEAAVFEDDFAALQFVKDKAAAGDLLAIKALKLDHEHSAEPSPAV